MRHLKLALILLLAAPLFGAYQYYYSDTFPNTTINSTYWLLRGSVYGGSTGLDVGYGTSGSVTSKVAVPDGSADYEVKATLHLEDSSWLSETEYRIYLRQNSAGTS